jgi:hypothetical protein
LRGLSRVVLPLALVLLPSCSGGVGSGSGDVAVEGGGTTGATGVSIIRAKPFDAYVAMGGDIKRCWFNPVDPLLPAYVYRADVSPDGSKVQISVHQRVELGRAGGTTYIIDFKQSGPSTVITTENRKMPPNLAAKMVFDIDRWKRGQSDCSKEMPTMGSVPAPKPAAGAR